MQKDNIKGSLKHLQNVATEPSPRVWDRLEKQLNERKKEKQQRVFNFSVAAALILLSALVFTQLYNKPDTEVNTVHQWEKQTQDTLKVENTKPANDE